MEERCVTRKSTREPGVHPPDFPTTTVALEYSIENRKKVQNVPDQYNPDRKIVIRKTQTFELEYLPDEVILQMLCYLSMKELLNCGQVSKRIRAISHDETLWQKVNLHRQRVPTDYLETILNNGCKHLTLKQANLVGNLCIRKPSQLKYLDLDDCDYNNVKVIEELLASCYSLEKLSLSELTLTSKIVKSMCYQNGQTLQIINLCNCDGLNLESMKHIVDNCRELREIDFSANYGKNTYESMIPEDAFDYLANNLTPKIEKLNLFSQWNLEDKHVKALVSRCNKITELNLYGTLVSKDALMSIIGNLKLTLEKLEIENVHYANLIQLKSFSRLRILRCKLNCDCCDYESLRQQLPHISINPSFEERARIAEFRCQCMTCLEHNKF